jgi:hypothetical protein
MRLLSLNEINCMQNLEKDLIYIRHFQIFVIHRNSHLLGYQVIKLKRPDSDSLGFDFFLLLRNLCRSGISTIGSIWAEVA